MHPDTYLATVEVLFCKKVKFLATVVRPSFFGDGLLQEALPDTPSSIQTQCFILQREVYSARDGVINLVNPVGFQEHDLLVILWFSQEHRDEGIAVNVME